MLEVSSPLLAVRTRSGDSVVPHSPGGAAKFGAEKLEEIGRGPLDAARSIETQSVQALNLKEILREVITLQREAAVRIATYLSYLGEAGADIGSSVSLGPEGRVVEGSDDPGAVATRVLEAHTAGMELLRKEYVCLRLMNQKAEEALSQSDGMRRKLEAKLGGMSSESELLAKGKEIKCRTCAGESRPFIDKRSLEELESASRELEAIQREAQTWVGRVVEANRTLQGAVERMDAVALILKELGVCSASTEAWPQSSSSEFTGSSESQHASQPASQARASQSVSSSESSRGSAATGPETIARPGQGKSSYKVTACLVALVAMGAALAALRLRTSLLR